MPYLAIRRYISLKGIARSQAKQIRRNQAKQNASKAIPKSKGYLWGVSDIKKALNSEPPIAKARADDGWRRRTSLVK